MSTRRWSRTGFILAGVLCYALFLLVTLPASWMQSLLTRISRGAVTLDQTEGTFWSGTGNLVVRGAIQEPLQARLAWSLEPLWLFTGKLAVQVQARGDTELHATLRLGYRYLAVSNANATLSATKTAIFYAPVMLATPAGQLQVATDRLELDSGGLHGTLRLTWVDAGSSMAGLNKLGDYQMTVKGEGANAAIRVDTLRGDVDVTATGNWQAGGDGTLRLDGKVAPGSREQSLAPLLSAVNAQRSGDQYTFSASARIPVRGLLGN